MRKIEHMAHAIMEFEGYAKGSINYNNHNPGNLKVKSGIGRVIANDSFGHSIFRTFEDGWDALVGELDAAVNGRSHVHKPTDTLRQFFGAYSEANQETYTNFVATRLAVAPETQLLALRR